MDFPQFVGPFYTMWASKAEIESCRNLYLEQIESGQGRNQFALFRSHGLKSQAATIGRPKMICRGFLELNDHLYDVQDDTIYDMVAGDNGLIVNGTFGPIANDGLPVSMDASATALFIVSANILYRLSGSVTQPTVDFTPTSVSVIEGLVVCTALGTDGARNRFYFSSDDGVTWDAIDFETAQAYPNALINSLVAFQELWLFGNRRTQVFVIGSDPNAPLTPVMAGVIEMGLTAKFGIAKLDNSIFWLGSNKDGDHMVWRANGYSPARVSNHAIENAFRSYPRHDDAIMTTYQLNGHSSLRITFPSANDGRGATWDFDVSSNVWTEAAFWNSALQQYERHRCNFFASAFQKIYGGDYANGMLYEFSPDYYTDFGYPVRWERRCPHVSKDGKRLQFRRFGVFMQTGVGLTTPIWINDHSIDPVTFAADLAALVGATTITAAQSTAMQAIYDWQPYDQDLALPDSSVMTPLGFYDYGNYPTVELRWSNDGGNTFGPYVSRTLGRAGQFKQRIYWNRPGNQSRDRVWELSGDGPVQTAIVQAVFDAVICNN